MTRTLALPGGLDLPVPDGETVTAVYARHCFMSVSEGICPAHQTPLTPVAVRPDSGVTAGAHCGACRKFWSVKGDRTVSWYLDHHPHEGTAVIPEWAA